MIWLGLATLIVVFVVGFRVLTSDSRRAIRRLSERLGITPVPLESRRLAVGALTYWASLRCGVGAAGVDQSNGEGLIGPPSSTSCQKSLAYWVSGMPIFSAT